MVLCLQIKTAFLFTQVYKKLYVTKDPGRPRKLSISEHAGFCRSFPSWYFLTFATPHDSFSQAIYVYSVHEYLILQTTRNDKLYGNLLRYFYVANDNQFNQSQAVHAVLQDQDGISYVTKFLSRPTLNNTDYVFFVKEFGTIEGLRNSLYMT